MTGIAFVDVTLAWKRVEDPWHKGRWLWIAHHRDDIGGTYTLLPRTTEYRLWDPPTTTPRLAAVPRGNATCGTTTRQCPQPLRSSSGWTPVSTGRRMTFSCWTSSLYLHIRDTVRFYLGVFVEYF
ncbi:Uncharacterised protein [Mycobacteroides abscessus subsp. bolletii]|nr:Uncharacterised protein [Mycobacteroides abscessus subsp. bolletii]